MKALKIYNIQKNNCLDESDKKEIRALFQERLSDWLFDWKDDYLKKYLDDDEGAIEKAKLALSEFESFWTIQKDYELINADILNEPESYKYQMGLVNEFTNNQ
tara:strand:- start:639 stop:947 length:309 start_codon:yes stop_codon:yes gene_type:complete